MVAEGMPRSRAKCHALSFLSPDAKDLALGLFSLSILRLVAVVAGESRRENIAVSDSRGKKK